MPKKKETTNKRVKVYIAPDLAERLAASGEDLETRVNALLRASIDAKPQGKLGSFMTELGIPQIEKAAKEVATRVAKEVATAALAAWATKMEQKPKGNPTAASAKKRGPRKPAPSNARSKGRTVG